MITVLTGGTGGAKFVDGLRQVVPQEELTIIVNTGDDLMWWGLYVSPDVDSITYMLAGRLSQERGWGVKGDTFYCLKAMGQLGQPTWFNTGDRDLATHVFRSKLLADGKTLSEVTAEIASRLGVRARVLPMSDSRVETRVKTPVGELSFEEYFVQRWYQDPVESVRFAGASDAEPAPGVIQAIRSAEMVLLAPSNPITSIGPILAVPGIREALRESRARIAAVSPIVGGAAVTGPAGALLAAEKYEVSIAGVADCYHDFLDLLVVDAADADTAEKLRETGVRVHVTATVMRRNEGRVALARSVMEACAGTGGAAAENEEQTGFAEGDRQSRGRGALQPQQAKTGLAGDPALGTAGEAPALREPGQSSSQPSSSQRSSSQQSSSPQSSEQASSEQAAPGQAAAEPS